MSGSGQKRASSCVQQTLAPFGHLARLGKGSAPKRPILGAQIAFIGDRDLECTDRKRPTR
jgi:hypothetical protein